MKTLNIVSASIRRFKVPEIVLLLVTLIMLWPVAARLISNGDATAGYVDPSIWLLVLMSVICFLALVGLCWWLLDRLWESLELPDLKNLVLQFKNLQLWYQLGFFWASFALLLLAAVGCLTAIC